jgi:hypothetical protein
LGGVLAAAMLLLATGSRVQAATPKQNGFIEVNNAFSATQAPTLYPGDWIGAGYSFQMTGARPAQLVTVEQGTAWLQVACEDTDAGTGTIAGTIQVPLSGGPYATAAGATDWYPFTGTPGLYTDGFDPLTYQGVRQAPDLCNGGTMWVNAEVFQANLGSTDAVDQLLFRFHAATASGAVDCADALQNPAPGVAGCGAAWTGTAAQSANAQPASVSASADPSGPGFITISGSMEGDYKFNPGDWIGGGFTFQMTGAKPAQTVQFNGATVSMPVSCANDSSHTIVGTIVIALSGGPYTTTAGASDWYPFSGPHSDSTYNDGYDPADWQGNEQAPALCGAGEMEDQTGATFEANVTSTDTVDQLMVRFHYGPHGNPGNTVDCGDPSQNTPPGAATCGASWSGTENVTPGPPSPPPSIPDGQPYLLTLLGAAGLAGSLVRLRRRS